MSNRYKEAVASRTGVTTFCRRESQRVGGMVGKERETMVRGTKKSGGTSRGGFKPKIPFRLRWL